MMIDQKEWRRECDRAARVIFESTPGHYAEDLIDAGERLRAVAYAMAGVGCNRCCGIGRRTYGDTSTWAGGIGGQSLTDGVCDECWGTGRRDRIGVNLRKLKAKQEKP
jgi:hypothetical protein